MSPNSTISYSKYETNPFLNLQEPSLIEYAAFFGSSQIFECLYKNGVELKPSLWNFAIHGNNLNLLNILKDKKVPPEYDFFWFSLKEAMKCHHIEVAEFIKQNFVQDYDENRKPDGIVRSIVRIFSLIRKKRIRLFFLKMWNIWKFVRNCLISDL